MAKLRGSRRPAAITMDRIRQKAVVLGRCEGAFSRCSSPPVSEFLPLELKNAFSGRSVRLWGPLFDMYSRVILLRMAQEDGLQETADRVARA